MFFKEHPVTGDQYINPDGKVPLKVRTKSGCLIELYRYSDPDRKSLARSAALYLGKADTDNIKRPLQIMANDHTLEIFRGESADFIFYMTPKQVYDHLVTYKTCNMRVAGGNRALISKSYTAPVDRMKDPQRVEEELQVAMDRYWRLAETETPQVARSIMPVNADMEPFRLQFNFQTLIQALFPQRIFDLGAQGLTVEVVQGMWNLVYVVDPELWGQVYELYGPHAKDWKMAQRKLRKAGTSVGEFVSKVTELDGFHWEMSLETAIRLMYGKRKNMWG